MVMTNVTQQGLIAFNMQEILPNSQTIIRSNILWLPGGLLGILKSPKT